MDRNDLINSLKEIFPSRTWPRPLHILQGLTLADSGTPIREAAKAVGTNHASVIKASQDPDPVRAVLGLAFEQIYKSEMHSEEFELRDLREGRTDTDYRLYNGRGRPIYRVNIKFHGSPFRRAPEMVGLESDDCFALATTRSIARSRNNGRRGFLISLRSWGFPTLPARPSAVTSHHSLSKL